VARHPTHADCESCEAPCCRRQTMTLGGEPAMVRDMRPLYRAAGTDITVVGFQVNDDGSRQPAIRCKAFDLATLACGVYDRRPEHCQHYDCRADDPDTWESRAHCDLARHRRMEAARERERERERLRREVAS